MPKLIPCAVCGRRHHEGSAPQRECQRLKTETKTRSVTPNTLRPTLTGRKFTPQEWREWKRQNEPNESGISHDTREILGTKKGAAAFVLAISQEYGYGVTVVKDSQGNVKGVYAESTDHDGHRMMTFDQDIPKYRFDRMYAGSRIEEFRPYNANVPDDPWMTDETREEVARVRRSNDDRLLSTIGSVLDLDKDSEVIEIAEDSVSAWNAERRHRDNEDDGIHEPAEEFQPNDEKILRAADRDAGW